MGIEDFVLSGRMAVPRKTFVQGVEGIGKSTFAACFPNPIFIQTEEGLNDITTNPDTGQPLTVKRLPLCKSIFDVKGWLTMLAQDEHQYKTLVIDTVDWLEQYIWKFIADGRGVTHIEEIGWAKGYRYAMVEWHYMVSAFEWLRANKGMNIVLLSHTMIKKFDDPERESYDRYIPKLHELASSYLREWCDEVLFANYNVWLKEEDSGFGKKRSIAVGEGKRVLRTVEKPSHMAKNRLGMPAEIPLSFLAYAQFAFPELVKDNAANEATNA